jgi:hypothetical protein
MCEEHMQARLQYIFLHNTFSQYWEAQPYINLAEKYGYNTFVVETQNPYISIHDVPARTVDNMIARWQTSTEFNRNR